MDLVKVKINTTVITNRYGTLSEGDVLRTDAAYAKHLVEDCGAATLLDTPAAPLGRNESPVVKPARRKKAEPSAAPAAQASLEPTPEPEPTPD